MSHPTSPLHGMSVLEISSRPAGAYCGRLLAQLGASVTRVNLPIAADCSADVVDEYARLLGLGKQEVAEEDPALDALARNVDLVVTDSLHDDALDGRARTIAIGIVASVEGRCPVVDIAAHLEQPTAAGGSPEHTPALPLTASAQAAMSWSLGHPGMEPLTLPVDVPDYLNGAEAAGVAALALLVGTIDRANPRRWSVSASDTLAYYVGQICANFIPYERPWHRDGARASMSGGSYPAAMFECRDGQVSIMCRTRREWHALLHAMGDPAWSQQDHFRDARVVALHHADEADEHLKAWTASHTCDEIFALGTAFSFPVAPVLTVAESLELEQFAVREFVTKSDDLGGLRVPGVPWKCSEPRTGRPAGRWPNADFSDSRPLAGLRVLDLSWVWSGPMVTAALSDLGAEIIKVENRNRADPARLRGRARRAGVPVDGPELEVTPYFNQMNRGKRSVALDIGTDSGRELILDLVEQCDVVVENMRPGALERRRLDYAHLAERNPSVIMLSMSIMGQTGPMRGVGGYAPVMSGLAGLDSLVGYSPHDLIGLYNPALGDPNGAAHAMATLMAALVDQQRTGRGRWIDLAQVEALVSVLPGPILETQRHGEATVRGNGHALFWPHATVRTSGDDTWLAVAARTDAERSRLAAVVGLPAGASPSAFEEALRAWAAGLSTEAALAALRPTGVPAASVRTYEDLVGSQWGRDRGLYEVLPHPYLADQPLFNLPWKVAGHGFPARSCAPLLGSGTDTVLTEILGLSPTRLAELRAAGAIE
jgi:crotonobetainyl-CoA:carnitine CoA-transferase CaiB-like acyl-CoA transferase